MVVGSNSSHLAVVSHQGQYTRGVVTRPARYKTESAENDLL